MYDSMNPRLRVMLLDDHGLVRYGLELLLKQDEGIDIIGSYTTSHQLFEALKTTQPDVLVTDYSLGRAEIDGARLIRTLSLRYPRLRMLVVSCYHNPATVALALRAGAHGFVGKGESDTVFHQAVHRVAAGHTYFSLQLPEPVKPGEATGEGLLDFRKLSPREHEVLRCMLDGMSISAIAKKFSRSVTTISQQKTSAFRKLGLYNNNEFFKLRYMNGVSGPPKDI